MQNRILNAVTVFGFLVLIALPLLRFSPEPWTDLAENRTSAPLPPTPSSWAALQKYPSGFEAFFNDHFGFRNELIGSHAIFKYYVLRISPHERVLLGKNQWLFYTGNESIPDFKGEIVPDTATLAAWSDTLKQRQDWLAERGIAYRFVIAPNKQTIYPEFMPPGIVRGTTSRRQQILGYLASRGGLSPVVDAAGLMLQAKGGPILFHPLDTHWNPAGAYLGYRALMTDLLRDGKPEGRMLDIPDAQFVPSPVTAGDLTNMMGLKQGIYRAVISSEYAGPRLNCGQYALSDAAKVPPHKPADIVMDCPAGAPGTRALIFSDSMIEAMTPYLAESFGHIRITRHDLGPDELEAFVREERPTVVIEERSERRLLQSQPQQPN
jgi:hypothetical protein